MSKNISEEILEEELVQTHSVVKKNLKFASQTVLHQPLNILKGRPKLYTKGSNEICKKNFASKRFYLETERKLPPIFYSFPGSGNTWGRLLIEFATGIYSGSIYNDKSLFDIMPGEYTCSWRVSVIKVHPHTHGYKSGENPFGLGQHFKSDNDKCVKGNVLKFKRAVFLIRDPYDSIWSEFQRRVSKSHVSGILKSEFHWEQWYANAGNLAHRYLEMWKHYGDMTQDYGIHNIIFVRYEDLRNISLRVATLRKVVDFLHVPTTDERVSCAFNLSENKGAHRKVKGKYMSKTNVYTADIVCGMWQLFGKYSSLHDYHIKGNFDCSSYYPIEDCNVGPVGQYLGPCTKHAKKSIF